ncbi:hypothetical protein EVAR_50341_1 [Eumeta japonica]|uniref:Uncharacterized protein n=1 Tax=Eumeta variegata TaxID=151549 RepID=A0A4C1XRJ3_EUMVA|nr:hypothetical protein EVAR_50341_1 [Eumeta japonica]
MIFFWHCFTVTLQRLQRKYVGRGSRERPSRVFSPRGNNFPALFRAWVFLYRRRNRRAEFTQPMTVASSRLSLDLLTTVELKMFLNKGSAQSAELETGTASDGAPAAQRFEVRLRIEGVSSHAIAAELGDWFST